MQPPAAPDTAGYDGLSEEEILRRVLEESERSAKSEAAAAAAQQAQPKSDPYSGVSEDEVLRRVMAESERTAQRAPPSEVSPQSTEGLSEDEVLQRVLAESEKAHKAHLRAMEIEEREQLMRALAVSEMTGPYASTVPRGDDDVAQSKREQREAWRRRHGLGKPAATAAAATTTTTPTTTPSPKRSPRRNDAAAAARLPTQEELRAEALSRAEMEARFVAEAERQAKIAKAEADAWAKADAEARAQAAERKAREAAEAEEEARNIAQARADAEAAEREAERAEAARRERRAAEATAEAAAANKRAAPTQSQRPEAQRSVKSPQSAAVAAALVDLKSALKDAPAPKVAQGSERSADAQTMPTKSPELSSGVKAEPFFRGVATTTSPESAPIRARKVKVAEAVSEEPTTSVFVRQVALSPEEPKSNFGAFGPGPRFEAPHVSAAETAAIARPSLVGGRLSPLASDSHEPLVGARSGHAPLVGHEHNLVGGPALRGQRPTSATSSVTLTEANAAKTGTTHGATPHQAPVDRLAFDALTRNQLAATKVTSAAKLGRVGGSSGDVSEDLRQAVAQARRDNRAYAQQHAPLTDHIVDPSTRREAGKSLSEPPRRRTEVRRER